MNAIHQLVDYGQSCWLDNLTRSMLDDGSLEHLVSDVGVRGITSNPSTFSKAIAGGDDYDRQIREAADSGLETPEIYEALATTDVRRACDVLRPVYDQSRGRDGFVSLEVSPHLAHDTEGSIAEGRRLFAAVDRPNLFIKVPGTEAGVPAIEELLSEGVNVNITLLFSIERYEEVAQAYMRALERRIDRGQPVESLASVASFFLSRIDTLVDQLLGHRIRSRGNGGNRPDPQELLGKTAVANAKLAYQRFKALTGTPRWQDLAGQDAAVQRMLWASTSAKNPDYDDLAYVSPLIGPDTINTMPEKTMEAFREKGTVAESVENGIDDAKHVLESLATLGIDMEQVTGQLENEGIQKFLEPYDSLMENLERKRARFLQKTRRRPVEEAARRLRRETISMTTEAGSGHATSCLSCADLVAALFFDEMRWDPRTPEARDVDTFVLSKGHAAPILWAALADAGAIDEPLASLRRIDSSLEGHPTPRNPWVKVATGSLGQGLAAANGIAAANTLDGIDARVFCLLGDGECSEGAVWEAAQFASLNKLSNLVAIVDVNGLGQSVPAPYDHDTGVLAKRFESFGWRSIEIDGHDMGQILDALFDARDGGPVAIIARTEKGRGVSFLEGAEGWHGKPLGEEDRDRALAEIGEPAEAADVTPRRLGGFQAQPQLKAPRIDISSRPGDEIATRKAFGGALARLGEQVPQLVCFDGDVQNSTGTADFAEAFPDRFFQGYIAEQNMVGAALGMAASGKLPVVATFAAFLSRAYDFIRMAGYSFPEHLVFCGSHAGVSIGEDGPSQMGLEDIAMFRALADSTVLYPCDGVSAERLTEEACRVPGIVYLRTTRGKTPVIYGPDESFEAGGSKVLRSSDVDDFTIVAAGITVHEALAAHDALKERGIMTRVIDAYSVKPLDGETLKEAARETGGIVVVEDHWIDGGLGDAVAAYLSGDASGPLVPVHRMAIKSASRSGSPGELLDRHGISCTHIAAKVAQLALVH